MTVYLPVLCSSGPWCSACSSSSKWQAVPLEAPGTFLFSCRHKVTVQEQTQIRHLTYMAFTAHQSCSKFWKANLCDITAAYLRGDTLRRLDADRGVPLSWRQDSHLVQEFIDPSKQVTSVLGLVRYVVENLEQREVKDKGDVSPILTPLPHMMIFNLYCFWSYI